MREKVPSRTVDSATYNIQRYRPRIEGLFARLERWTNVAVPADILAFDAAGSNSRSF